MVLTRHVNKTDEDLHKYPHPGIPTLVSPWGMFTTLGFLPNLQIDPISSCYLTLGKEGLSGKTL
jgi:hypothetical protein